VKTTHSDFTEGILPEGDVTFVKSFHKNKKILGRVLFNLLRSRRMVAIMPKENTA